MPNRTVYFLVSRDFQYSIGDARALEKRRSFVVWYFQYSIGDAMVFDPLDVAYLPDVFQYSIGDACLSTGAGKRELW